MNLCNLLDHHYEALIPPYRLGHPLARYKTTIQETMMASADQLPPVAPACSVLTKPVLLKAGAIKRLHLPRSTRTAKIFNSMTRTTANDGHSRALALIVYAAVLVI